MRRLFAPVLVAFAALLAPAAVAQITVTQFEEVYGAEQPVSGRGFVGAVLAVDAAGAVAIEKLEVFIPPGTAGDIKVNLISADAKYRGTVTAPGGSGGDRRPLRRRPRVELNQLGRHRPRKRAIQ